VPRGLKSGQSGKLTAKIAKKRKVLRAQSKIIIVFLRTLGALFSAIYAVKSLSFESQAGFHKSRTPNNLGGMAP
jgi:hypothetical protein